MKVDDSCPSEIGASFRCRACQKPAKMIVDDVDVRIERVFCTVCDASVEWTDAQTMYDELIKRFVEQKARQVSREILRNSGTRVPLSNVDDEFSDPAYPFILVINE